MQKSWYLTLLIFLTLGSLAVAQQWEAQGNFYFLSKNKANFSVSAPGSNKLPSKYLSYDGVDFLVRGPADWQDYGRLNIGNNSFFQVPLRQGMKISALHFLASGDYGNSYLHDRLLKLYGENYFYSVLTVTWAYQDGTYKVLSAPVFWDWFHLPSVTWSKDGIKVKPVGINPVRPKCTMYHISFDNPRPMQPIKDILISDSWVSDQPFSDVFSLTISSMDKMEAAPRKDQ